MVHTIVGMKLGLDFDNTLIDYDEVIRAAAVENGMLPADNVCRTKREVRDHIRKGTAGDLGWQKIQSYIYAEGIMRARRPAGLDDFLEMARDQGIELWIVSHKTRTAPFDPAQRDLRAAALQWMEANRFFDPRHTTLRRDRVVFADTLAEKVNWIRKLQLTAFVDDLEEVLNHTGFPAATRRILYGTGGRTPAIVSYGSWNEVSCHVAGLLGAEQLAAALPRHSIAAVEIRQVAGGRNSRSYHVTSGQGETEALFVKQYFRSVTDRRDRLTVEYGALTFMRRAGIECVPAPVFRDDETYTAGYELVRGAPALDAATGEAEVVQLIAFLEALHRASHTAAAALGTASEAFFSFDEICANLEARRERLRASADPELRDFLAGTFDLVRPRVLAQTREELRALGCDPTQPLPPARRTLSPSDVGFHNALRGGDGRLTFVDFEYFGWDDPAKLMSDFLLQPEQRLSGAARQLFFERAVAIYDDPTLAARQPLFERLFRLKWVAILLNEFVRDDRARRRFAGAESTDLASVRRRQLEKARRMLAPLEAVNPSPERASA